MVVVGVDGCLGGGFSLYLRTISVERCGSEMQERVLAVAGLDFGFHDR